jgi:hypothetical protein
MTLQTAIARAKAFMHIASKKVKHQYADEATISELVELVVWSKEHAPHPGILSGLVVSSDDSRLTWEQVNYAARTILTSLTTGQQ